MPVLRSHQVPSPATTTKSFAPQPATPSRSREPTPTLNPETPCSLPRLRRSSRLASKSALTPNVPREKKTATGVCCTEEEEEKGKGNGQFGSEGNVIDEKAEGFVGVDYDGSNNISSGVLSLRSGKRVGRRIFNEKGGESEGKRRGKWVEELRMEVKEVKMEKVSENHNPLVIGVKGVVLGDVDGEKLISEVDSSGDSRVKKRRRYSREEKGKKVVYDSSISGCNGGMEAELQSEVKDLVEGLSKSVKLERGKRYKDENVSKNVLLEDEKRDRNGNVRKEGSRMEQFRDIARQNASRFAHFEAEELVEDSLNPEVGAEMPSGQDDVEKVEDWPGPFSTAMKIIRDRKNKLHTQHDPPSEGKTVPVPIMWIPKSKNGRDCLRRSVPSLQELASKILVNNVDAIASLESVPDALRHNLCRLLCDSRRMNSHILDLLVCGSPTEVRIKDCSWLSEETFTKYFESCDTSNLRVLQIDQTGRCLTDYALPNTLTRSSGSLPVLITLSVQGACRLSDVGLLSLVSSAPALQSINLSQCSLLSSSGLDILSNSLGPVLQELYIDDCQGIDAMLILPALKKFEHLEVLSMRRIQTVCDDFVKDLIMARGHNMKELVFSDCLTLTDSSMKVIAETCGRLRSLDLCNLRKLTDSTLGYLANGCREIDSLILCRNTFSDEAIAAFVETSGESLKHLSLNNVRKVGHNTALSIAKRSRKLLNLDLSFCRNLSNEALGLIVDSCPLKVLKVFGCSQITEVFLDGHSNPEVKIIGLSTSRILETIGVSYQEEFPLRYSSVSPYSSQNLSMPC